MRPIHKTTGRLCQVLGTKSRTANYMSDGYILDCWGKKGMFIMCGIYIRMYVQEGPENHQTA